VLEELHVKDLALIEETWLELGPGMTALTGETGAGKTVLVGALKLLLGERADATVVRSGAAEAVVEGRFVEGGVEHAARRRVGADGRSRCYLDGEMATVGGLAETLGPLVDLHGQHDHQELLRPATHAALLDRFAGSEPLAEAYRDAFRSHAAAAAELGRVAAAMDDRQARLAVLQAAISDIDRIAPEAGEDDAIAARLPRLRHGEKLTGASSAAYRALSEEGAASDRLGEAVAALGRVTGIDPVLDEKAEALAELETRLAEVAQAVRDYGEAVEYDPAALEEAEARLAALSVLKRSFGPTLEDVIAARMAAQDEAATLEAGEEGLDRLRAAVETADGALREAAAALSSAREKAAPIFVERLAEASRDLAMPSGRFEVSRTALERDGWTSEGPERLEFLYAPGPGETPRPLARIASGGEVSRVMLALKSVLGHADTVPVLVFDEIDAGIGGATALAVGARLKALSDGRQVLVVTHLAQVAAFADAHLVVEKSRAGGRDRTGVRAAAGEERIVELARMLSGSDTDASLAHARELLSSVGLPGV
jgi:DNA repair protein RecN (Recombination protein N)